MKNTMLAGVCLFLSLYTMAQLSATTAKINLLSPYFLFTEQAAAAGELNATKANGQFPGNSLKEAGFSIKMRVKLQDFQQEQWLLQVRGKLSLKLRQADPLVRDRQNYPAFPLADGKVPVMEAAIQLTAPVDKTFKQELLIGFPLAMMNQPWGEHEIVLHFTGTRWSIYADGQLMDNEFAIGYPSFNNENDWKIDTAAASSAAIFFPALAVVRDSLQHTTDSPDIQYWTPRWHNAWVGDVATLYYKGRYHVFYLFDRRHHASKFGVGGHYFEHISTADFKTWQEHEAAVPIDEQWETIGTGTPFVLNDQLHIAYGLHTSRIYPAEKTMTNEQKLYYDKHGKTRSFAFDLQAGYPSGATYSTSTNGVDDFKKSRKLFHYAENPSVFIDPAGKLRMIANFGAKGIWGSETLDSNWYSISPDFPPGGDCTFFFRWGKYDYIIGGFVNLWNKPATAGNEAWRDMVKEGIDFYNGINVPAITEIPGGRFLMAGWFPIRGGWGGPFVLHEMIQYPDGRIGTRWMKELMPLTENKHLLAQKLEKEKTFPVTDESFMISFKVHPQKNKTGKLALSLLPADGYTNGCEFQLRLDEAVAQYGESRQESFSPKSLSQRNGSYVPGVGNYALENLVGIDKPFTVRMIVRSNAKLGGTIVDTEIAAQRTMISYRADLQVKRLQLRADGAAISQVQMEKIK